MMSINMPSSEIILIYNIDALYNYRIFELSSTLSDAVMGMPLDNHTTSGTGSPVRTALNLTVSPSQHSASSIFCWNSGGTCETEWMRTHLSLLPCSSLDLDALSI